MTSLGGILGLGLNPQDLSLGQLLLRAVIVCFVMYVMIRLAGRRFLAQKNPFDILLAFLMASLISRHQWFDGILGNHPARTDDCRDVSIDCVAAYRFHSFGKLLKGEPNIVVENGHLQKIVMSRHCISEHDLHEDMSLAGNVDDLKQVKKACLERSGEISILRQPRIFRIEVQKGVQTIHLLIE